MLQECSTGGVLSLSNLGSDRTMGAGIPQAQHLGS